MEKYKQLVQQLYIEPKNEKILGSFLQANEMIDVLKLKQFQKRQKWRENKLIRQLTDKMTYAIFLRNKEL